VLFNVVDRLEKKGSAEDLVNTNPETPGAKDDTLAKKRGEGGDDAGSSEEPLGKEGGFQLVFKQKYLLFIGLMVLVANLVNTTGEYILSSAAETHAAEVAPIPADVQTQLAQLPPEGEATKEQNARRDVLMKPINDSRSDVVKEFFGSFFTWVNVVVLIIQLFFVSRIFKYFGVRPALFFLPIIALGGYLAIGLLGGIMLLRVAKTAENATDYSLQNTVKQALFLPTSREAKYKAKAAIDTFFVRIGDALAAGLVAVGIHQLGFTPRNFAITNVLFILLWLGLNVGISRGHKALSEGAQEAAEPT